MLYCAGPPPVSTRISFCPAARALAITNAGNAVHSVYVFSLPLGPIWFLHTFYLVASALMLMWFLRYRATWQRRASNATEASLTPEPEPERVR